MNTLELPPKTLEFPVLGLIFNADGSNRLETWNLKGKTTYLMVEDMHSDLVNVPMPPIKVPLGPEDIRPGDVLRARSGIAYIEGAFWKTILSAHGRGVMIAIHGDVLLHSFDTLQECFEISHDNGKTWSKCEKLVEPERCEK